MFSDWTDSLHNRDSPVKHMKIEAMEAPQRDGFPSSASTTQYNALGRAWTQEPAELKSVGRCCLKDQLGEVWKYINLYIYIYVTKI